MSLRPRVRSGPGGCRSPWSTPPAEARRCRPGSRAGGWPRLDGRGLVRAEQVAAPTDGAVHLGPAHLLEGNVLADNLLRHPRRAQVHGGVALDHEGDVTEGGNVGATGGAGAE